MLREIRGAEFQDAVLGKDGTSLVVFWATWCPFCARFKPIFDERAARSDVDMVSVDISEDSDPLWDEYNVNTVPTLVLFEDGLATSRRDGIPGIGLSEGALDGILSES